MNTQTRVTNTETTLGIDSISGQTIAVADRARQSGMYIIGVQGRGKSSIIESLIFQDIEKGNSVIVIDPHQDLIMHAASQLPQKDVDRCFLLDLGDYEYPFGLNIFATAGGNNATLEERLAGVGRCLHIFDRLFPGESRMLLEKVLRFLTYLLIDNPGTSLADIPRILDDDDFRSKLVKRCRNRRARLFWQGEYEGMSPSNRSKLTAPIMNRLPSLLSNPLLENIVSQKTSSIDFRRCIEQRQVIFIKLPIQTYKEVAPLIGTMLIAEIHRACFSFIDTPLDKRPGFSLYVDEFQNFSTPDFSELFTQGRKFGIRVTVAHQYRNQLTEDQKSATLTAQTLLSFAVVHSDARELASSFTDPNAVFVPLKDRVYKNVLAHLGEHPNDTVLSLNQHMFVPFQQKAKQEIAWEPKPHKRLPQAKTYADILALIERLCYLAQVEGFFRLDTIEKDSIADHKPAQRVLYYNVVGLLAYLYGFENYYLDHLTPFFTKRADCEAKYAKELSALQTEIEAKEALLTDTPAFLRFYTTPVIVGKDKKGKDILAAGCEGDWHKEIHDWKQKRSSLIGDLHQFLLLNVEGVKGRDILEITNVSLYPLRHPDTWLEKDIAFNKSLAPFACVEYLLSRKRRNMEYILALYYQQQEAWQQKVRNLEREELWGWLRNEDKKLELYYRRRDAGIGNMESEIEKLTAILHQGEQGIRSYNSGYLTHADVIAKTAQFFADLDTPDKVLAWLKKEFEEKAIAPLLVQVATVQRRFATEIGQLDTMLAKEKTIYENIDGLLCLTLKALSKAPLVENMAMSSTEVGNMLEHLPKRHALVRVADRPEGQAHVFVLRTLDTPPPVTDEEFSKRWQAIVDRSRVTLCRPRAEIEQELADTSGEKDDFDEDSDTEDDGEVSGIMALEPF